MSCEATKRSRIFDRKGRLEMGRKLLGSSGSRPGFFSIGVMAAILKAEGTVPEVRDEFTMSRTSGLRQGRQDLISEDGIGSNGQVESLILLKSFRRSLADMGDREANKLCGAAGATCC